MLNLCLFEQVTSPWAWTISFPLPKWSSISHFFANWSCIFIIYVWWTSPSVMSSIFTTWEPSRQSVISNDIRILYANINITLGWSFFTWKLSFMLTYFKFLSKFKFLRLWWLKVRFFEFMFYALFKLLKLLFELHSLHLTTVSLERLDLKYL